MEEIHAFGILIDIPKISKDMALQSKCHAHQSWKFVSFFSSQALGSPESSRDNKSLHHTVSFNQNMGKNMAYHKQNRMDRSLILNFGKYLTKLVEFW